MTISLFETREERDRKAADRRCAEVWNQIVREMQIAVYEAPIARKRAERENVVSLCEQRRKERT